ncbi:hypothetical protein Tco_0657865 [Tanacetum coccineum]
MLDQCLCKTINGRNISWSSSMIISGLRGLSFEIQGETPAVVVKFSDAKSSSVSTKLENLGKLQPTADIGIFVGYAPNRKGYRIYNKRTRQIMETIHVTFDELTEQMAPVQFSSGPAPILLTPGPISSGLVPNPLLAIYHLQLSTSTIKNWRIDSQPMFDEYFNPPGIRQNPIPVIPTAGEPSAEVNPFAAADPEPFVNEFAPVDNSEASSSGEINIPESSQSTQHHEHVRKWTDSHPIDNIIVTSQDRYPLENSLLRSLFCSQTIPVRVQKLKPKNFSSAATEDCWFFKPCKMKSKNLIDLTKKDYIRGSLDFEEILRPTVSRLEAMTPVDTPMVEANKTDEDLSSIKISNLGPRKRHLESVNGLSHAFSGHSARSTSDSAQFLGDISPLVMQRSKLARLSRLQKPNTSRCLVNVPKSYGCGLNYQIMALHTIASLCTMTTRVP